MSNRVRYEANGPLVGRFLAVGVQDDKSQLAGVALIFRTMEREGVQQEDARTIGAAHASVVENHRRCPPIR